MRALLERVAAGKGSAVMSELNRLSYPQVQTKAGPNMTCKEFAAKAIQSRELRLEKEGEAALVRQRREAREREQHLASILQRAEITWSGLNTLMDQKIASAYDQAAAQLKELREAYAQAGDIDGFRQKLAGFRVRYSNRGAMLRRIEKL